MGMICGPLNSRGSVYTDFALIMNQLVAITVLTLCVVRHATCLDKSQDLGAVASLLRRPHVTIPSKSCPGCEWVINVGNGSKAASIADGPKTNDIFVCTTFTASLYHVDLATNVR